MPKTVALVIAARLFRDEEYQVPKEILEQAGVQVVTVCTTLTEATGKLGLKVKPEKLLEELEVAQTDALIFIGGGGSEQYFNDPVAHQLARDFAGQGKIIGAICIAPVVLANTGLLRGKKATVYPDGQNDLEENGAIYTGNPVEVDGKLITGNGPEAAVEFGEGILKLLEI
ncbi:MAG TPA: DJ-1/PfpI family protein [Bacillota bacterium]|nr:DJ-1/PfpI family protein [Bacillota bacterium]